MSINTERPMAPCDIIEEVHTRDDLPTTPPRLLPVLQFLNPEVHGGINITVRNGSKWRHFVGHGDVIPVVETGREDEPLGGAVILATIPVDTLEKIHPYLLQFEHDQTCRTVEGLRAAMDRAYPDGHGQTGYTIVVFVPEF